MRRRPKGDEGASLVLALAFVTVISIGTTALLTLADTSMRTTQAVRQQGYELYSANGGLDQAISQVRADPLLGREGGACDLPPLEALNGVDTTVECRGLQDLGGGVGGGGNAVNESNRPPNAVLTLAGTAPNPEQPVGSREVGFLQSSQNELRINGPVISSSTVGVPVAGATLLAQGAEGVVRATGACTGNGTITATLGVFCPAAEPIPNRTDPNWPMDATRRQTPEGYPAAPVAAPSGCNGAGSQTLVVFEPGLYNSVAELNDLFRRCEGSVFWFKPGSYYFDFLDGSDSLRWEILGRDTHVVGGRATAGWVPAAAVGGGARPAVPFPGGCIDSGQVGATTGVQFAFGGNSRLFIKGARVELCAPANVDKQQIAVFGIAPNTPSTPAATVQQRSVDASEATRSPDNDTGFRLPQGVQGLDGDVAVFTASSSTGPGDDASVTAGFRTIPSIPFGSTITDVRLRVRQHPLNGNVSQLKAVVTPGQGTAVTLPTASGSCSGSTSALCGTPSDVMYDQRITLPASLRSVRALQDMTVRVEARAKISGGNGPNPLVTGEQRVDLLQIEVSYLPPSFRRLTGCTTVSLDAGGCPLLETEGAPTELAVQGTVYAPTAAVRLELTSDSTQAVRRGLVVRSARVTSTASSTYTGPAIDLPGLTPPDGVTGRTVLFTAQQAGAPVARAVVEFDDVAATATVKSWSVLR